MADVGVANKRWGEMLSHWAIPDDLVVTAPESPYFFDPQVFIAIADEALTREEDTPSDGAAREALPPGRAVLDVGCGAGAASLRLQPERVAGVDPSPELLEIFTVNAARLGIECSKVEGLWPQVASEAPDADVVVCHHVVYNVSDLASFVAALTRSPRRRVVVEVTAVHPMSWMAPYWEAIHGLPQPHEPIVQDVIAAFAELGLNVRQQRWNRPYQMIGETGEDSRSRIGAHPDGGTHEGAPEWVTRSRGERCRTRLPAPRYSAISRNRRARIGVRKRASLPPMDVRPTAG